jgi:hypothetical protein
MELYKYSSYEEYVKAQEHGNKKKLKSHSGTGPEVMAEIKKRIPEASKILCHGTRGGQEQKHFLQLYYDAEVIGTEISSTAKDIPLTVWWDFSKVNEEWIGQFDIVYSNAFDHSITPKETLSVWLDQLKEGGSLVLEMHLAGKNWKPTAIDPLSYKREDALKLVEELGARVVDEWESPKFTDHHGRYGHYNSGRPTIRVQK